MDKFCTWLAVAAVVAVSLAASAAWAADATTVVTKRGVSGQVYVWQVGSC